MEYDVEKREIEVCKELSNLDRFALDFVEIVRKHTDYVIISGYVSILLGRSRVTEDIDMFIPKISSDVFFNMYGELEEKGFWCLNTDTNEKAFDYLKEGYAIRFAKKGESIPNFEVKFPKDELDENVFNDFVTVILSKGKIKISCLERNIAFKKYFLGSDKDIEDAHHLEKIFRGKIDYDKLNKVKELINRRKENEREKNFFETRQE